MSLPQPAAEPEASRRMLLAAVDAFAERGFHATTTRDIAGRAGLSPAGLYVHFPSKAALLARISQQGHEAALELVTASAAAPGDASHRLRTVVAGFARWHAEHHRMARVVQYEFGALPADARQDVVALRRRIEQVVEDLIREGNAAGTLQADHPRRVARALLSLCVDVARWYDPAGQDTPEALGALYGELAVRMVTPPPAAETPSG